MWRTHHHIDGIGEDGPNGEGESTTFSSDGLGDMRVGLKYNVLPTLRSMVVLGFGVYLPTGVTSAKDSTGALMESTTQLGRGQVGLNPTIYQTYELIPHRLNQFVFAGYRHTFRNNVGYQFGDQWDVNGGFNLVTVPWLVLTAQLNYRYMVHDNFSSSLLRSATPADAPDFPGEPVVLDPNIQNRAVPTTGSTFLAFTPGFQISLEGTDELGLDENDVGLFLFADPSSTGFQQQSCSRNEFYLWADALVPDVNTIVDEQVGGAIMKISVVAAVLGVILVGVLVVNGWSMGSRVPVVGTPAEDFQLADLKGKTQSLSDYRGKVVLLNFWATWCKPCTTEMPAMQATYDKLAGQRVRRAGD